MFFWIMPTTGNTDEEDLTIHKVTDIDVSVSLQLYFITRYIMKRTKKKRQIVRS